jgi:hypothetical protein
VDLRAFTMAGLSAFIVADLPPSAGFENIQFNKIK